MATIDGHSVDGDDEGRHYLYALEYNEAKVLFEYAKRHGEAEFEDRKKGRNYTLKYQGGEYTVDRREGSDKKPSSGWF